MPTQQQNAVITDQEIGIRHRLMRDFVYFAPRCLKIRAKSGGLLPFILNKAQLYLHAVAERQRKQQGYVRIIVIKGRQQGISTYIEGRFYWRLIHSMGMKAFILTHEEKATTNLFEMVKRFHEHCPPALRPKTERESAKELMFSELDCQYGLATARTKETGRSQTIQFLHGSEVGFWPFADTHAAGLLQALPKGRYAKGTEAFFESTGNGVGNYFHTKWQQSVKGEGEFEPVFIPWFWQPEYALDLPEHFRIDPDEQEYKSLYNLNDEQIYWRRLKISDDFGGNDKLFQQEYPATPEQAFQADASESLISIFTVQKARNTEIKEPYGAMVLGVDPARYGNDRTSLVLRQGRKVIWVRSFQHKDTMEITGLVKREMDNLPILKCFVDVIGIGAGVVDRLREMGYASRTIAVNSAEKPLDDQKYCNKRAEIWCLMRDWLEDEPVDIPDSDSLAADLCSLKFKFDSNGRYVMEKKEDAKKRGIVSPDEADALALTFAIPVTLESNRYRSYEPEYV